MNIIIDASATWGSRAAESIAYTYIRFIITYPLLPLHHALWLPSFIHRIVSEGNTHSRVFALPCAGIPALSLLVCFVVIPYLPYFLS